MCYRRGKAGGKVMAPECSTDRNPPRVSLQPCRATGTREWGTSDSGHPGSCATFIWNITGGYSPQNNIQSKYYTLNSSFTTTSKWTMEYYKLWWELKTSLLQQKGAVQESAPAFQRVEINFSCFYEWCNWCWDWCKVYFSHWLCHGLCL